MKKIITNSIRQVYFSFIRISPPHRVDYYIHFTESRAPEVIKNRLHKSNYVKVYEYTSENEVKTFTYISGYQFRMLLRSIVDYLVANKGGFTLHSSATLINSRAFLFTGKSGLGKSTITNLLSHKYKKLSDDSLCIVPEGKKYLQYQTIMYEKPPLNKNPNGYFLGSIFFLKQSEDYKIMKIENKEKCLKLLYEQAWLEDSLLQKKQASNIMEFVNKFDNYYYIFSGLNSQKLISLVEEHAIKTIRSPLY